MNPNRLLSVLSFAVIATTASAQAVDINGGNSWNGWQAVGDSQSVSWVGGSTNRTFSMFSTYFVLDAQQGVGGVRLADNVAGNGVDYTGDNAASLFAGSWQAGDRIVGIGIQYVGATRGSTWFFHRDAGGANILPASSFGAGDGAFSHDVGDTSSHIINQATSGRGRVRQYSVWFGFSQNGSPGGGNYNIPYGTSPSLAMPVRSFTVLDAGSASLSKSMQYFLNIDAVLRANGGATFGDADFGPNTRFAFWEGSGAGFTLQSFTVPQLQQRRTALTGRPALGATVNLRHMLPLGLPGHIAGFLFSPPFAGEVPVTVPGFSVDGLLRVDPTAFPVFGVQLTDGVSLPSLAVGVPNVPALVGSQLECQSFDLAPSWTFYLAVNDVTLTVVAN